MDVTILTNNINLCANLSFLLTLLKYEIFNIADQSGTIYFMANTTKWIDVTHIKPAQ